MHPGWNYLRVRGEYSLSHAPEILPVELPPRARRILLRLALVVLRSGTTSACAENTSPMPHSSQPSRNYLRVRGEYISRKRRGL